MAIRLFDTDHDIVAAAVDAVRFPYSQIDRLALVVTMANHPALLVGHIPAILRLIVTDMECVIGAALGCDSLGHHLRPRSALPTFLRLLPTFLTALRTVEAFFFVFLAS